MVKAVPTPTIAAEFVNGSGDSVDVGRIVAHRNLEARPNLTGVLGRCRADRALTCGPVGFPIQVILDLDGRTCRIGVVRGRIADSDQIQRGAVRQEVGGAEE